MHTSLYFINPKNDFPVYYGAEVFGQLGLKPVSYMADLIGPTIAALAPDSIAVTLCDEHSTPIDFESNADFIGITGKSGQVKRMLEVARRFRQLGKRVIIGGPYATLVPEVVRPYCDILVLGELEAIAEPFFSDLQAGTWQTEYRGEKADLSRSPTPRWDLYRNDRALIGTLQTSRGCPFNCEFCDVIQYVGRKQRHKPIPQVVAELDVLYQQGYRQTFLADDNLTVYRRRAKELLTALRDWNHRQTDGTMLFSTQLSIDIARESEILQLCAEAGVIHVFIGTETPNQASIKESNKQPNSGIDLIAQIQRFLDAGIAVNGTMIVGFDADDATIFQQQYAFAMQTPVPLYALTMLVAPESTPLYERMKNANRLKTTQSEDLVHLSPWMTNIIPKQLSASQLTDGVRWLGNQLYSPAAFEQRVRHFIASYHPPEMTFTTRKTQRSIDLDALKVVHTVARLGEEERTMVFNLIRASGDTAPITQNLVLKMLFQYGQIRYMYQQGQFWDPLLAQQPAPAFVSLPFPQV